MERLTESAKGKLRVVYWEKGREGRMRKHSRSRE